MVKSVENGTSLPPFLVKCYEMVDDESTDFMISWSQSKDSFIIWDESTFSSQLLPKYFKHSNFSSFVRQLNIYGFRKTDTDRWEFANEYFLKGQKHLLKNILRRKHSNGPVQKPSQQKEIDSVPSKEDKRIALLEEVENLKTDKNALMQELKKLRQHQQVSRSKMLLVREQMKGMEKDQQQMLSFIVMAMQNPGFSVQFVQPKESNWRLAETGKNVLNEVTDDFSEPIHEDGILVKYQPPADSDSVPQYTIPASSSTDTMELDFSSDELRDLLTSIDFLSEPLDDQLLPAENQGQLALPEISDDLMLDHLLSFSPSTGNGRIPELDVKFGSYAVAEPKTSGSSSSSDDKNSESQNKQMEPGEFQSPPDKLGNMEVLTKQLKLLSSENSERL